jgi:hypothetical protein
VLVGAWVLFAVAVYLPDVGRGFVKDDFGWIDAGRAALQAPSVALLSPAPGFYRPIVALSFAFDYFVHGVEPRGYGFTNFALYVGCIAALWSLCRTLRLPPAAATLAAIVWAVNPHGINVAVVWISGRSALCLTLCALLAAAAIVRRQYAWTALCVAGALASKEEALVLPAILLIWHGLLVRDGTGDGRRDWWRAVAALVVPTAAYVAIRMHSGAFTPASAPPFYRFTIAPALVIRNALEYVDRAATISAIVLALAWVAYRVRPAVDRAEGRLLAACAAWFVGGYCLTLFLPVRSSLYAVFPSAGAAIACATIAQNMLARATGERADMRRLGALFAVILIVMVPTYRSRNYRLVEPARLSARALRAIDADATRAPSGGVIVLHDDDDPASSFVSAFGTFAGNAVRLRTARDVDVWIDPPPADWRLAGLIPPAAGQPYAAFALERGRIFKVDPY